MEINEQVLKAAWAFESAAIDAGYDYAKVTFESTAWNDGKPSLFICCVDRDNKTVYYTEGE